jgi:hypothetical protein
MTLLLDLSPTAGGVGTFAAVATLLVFVGVAFIAFKLLKRTVKMAFRMAIVAIILAIGLAGTIFFYAVGTDKPARTSRPAQTR